MNFKNSKFTRISSASQPTIKPSCIVCMAPYSYTAKVITLDLQNCCSVEHIPSFYKDVRFQVLVQINEILLYNKSRNLKI